MSYTYLTVESIQQRYHADMEAFKVDPTIEKNDFDIQTPTTELSPTKFEEVFHKILSSYTTLFGNKDLTKLHISLSTFDYSHHIGKFTEKYQQICWILRTQLFYFLLMVTVHMCTDVNIFNAVYEFAKMKKLDYGPTSSIVSNRRQFNKEVASVLATYKLGIFGSLTASSDIDVGIQYTGRLEVRGGLVYLVAIIEDLFLIFTGMKSIRWDIETYADLMTIPDESNKEIFFLDTSNFTSAQFNAMVPYIEASILRNYVFSQLETQDGEDDGGKKDVKTILASFNLPHFLESVDVRVRIFQPKDAFQTLSPVGIKMVEEYFSAPSYDAKRYMYYSAVELAEQAVCEHRLQLFTLMQRKQEEDLHQLSRLKGPDNIVRLMQLIARALVYREDSYVCAPTVMHVGRLMQAENSRQNPNCTDNAVKPTYAGCNIGRYGYLMSVYEQYGYIYRFHETYCLLKKGRLNLTTCYRKLKKYLNRLYNAIEMLPKLTDLLPVKKGGQKSTKRKGKRKGKKKKKKTRRPTQRNF